MDEQNDSVRAALRGNRLVCAALLVGQLMMAVVITVVHSLGISTIPLAPELGELFAWIGPGIGVGIIPLAYFLRRVIWQKGAGGSDAVVLQSFFAGNIAFQAMLEGAGLLNLTFWFITADALPYVPIVVVLILIGGVALRRGGPPSEG